MKEHLYSSCITPSPFRQCLVVPHLIHDDVIKWKQFPSSWPFVRGIHRSSMHSQHKGLWRRALIFSLDCTRTIVSWWFETPSRSLCRHCNGVGFPVFQCFYRIQATAVRYRYCLRSTGELILVTICGPFYFYGLTLIPAWISNRMIRKVWDKICIVEVWEWKNYFTTHVVMDMIKCGNFPAKNCSTIYYCHKHDLVNLDKISGLKIKNSRIIHYNDVIKSALASQFTSLTSVYPTVYSRRRPKKTSKFRVTGLCAGKSPETAEFPTQRASNA